VTQVRTRVKDRVCMAPGHIGPTATAPSMASLATIDTSSSVYAPTQLLNWVYLTLADQNQTCASDQVSVSSALTACTEYVMDPERSVK
jgi:hypothetical protein